MHRICSTQAEISCMVGVYLHPLSRVEPVQRCGTLHHGASSPDSVRPLLVHVQHRLTPQHLQPLPP